MLNAQETLAHYKTVEADAQQAAELVALKRDAERYRWLKVWNQLNGWTDDTIDNEIAIDKAIIKTRSPS